MKAISLVTLVLSAAFSANAFAAGDYYTICNSCTPFGQNQPAVRAAAVSAAQAHSAVVGDSIGVCKDIGMTNETLYYTVNTAPVTQSSNLTFTTSFFTDGACEDWI